MSFGGHAEHGDAEKRQAQYNAALKGGATGAAIGASVFIPTAYLLHLRWAPFRALPLPLKAFFVTTGTIASGVIRADKSGIAYDREHYSDEGAKKLNQNRSREDQEWAELSNRDKALTWAKENKFGVVAGSWVASMGGIFAYIHAQPMPFAQKLVQTRVWAQGLTLASLLGMAAITQIPSAGDKIIQEREHAADHSWRDFIGESSADPANLSRKKDASDHDRSNGGQNSKKEKNSNGSSSSDQSPGSSKGSNGSSGQKDQQDKSSSSKEFSDDSSKPPSPSQSSDSSESSKPNPNSKTNTSSSSQQGNSAAQAKQSEKSQGRDTSSEAIKEQAQPKKAAQSQTGKKAGYNGDN